MARTTTSSRTFTYAEAKALIPRVRSLTSAACQEVQDLVGRPGRTGSREAEEAVRRWVDAIHALGGTVKGLWLVDFDAGSGYYCWKHPEPDLLFFHSYDEGFSGRVPIQ